MSPLLQKFRLWLQTHKWSIASIFALILFLNAFATWYVRSEYTLYSYEEMGHWMRYMRIGSLLYSDPKEAVELFVRVLREYLWNYLVVLPMAIFYPFLKEARLPYILTLMNVVAIPASLSFIPIHALFLRKSGIAQNDTPKWLIGIMWVIPALLAVSYARFLFPALRGAGDIGGVVLINLILLFYFRQWDGRNYRRAIAMALFMLVAVFYRRWYSIWIAGAFAAMVVDAGYLWLTTRRWDAVLDRAKDAVLTAALFFGLLGLVSLPFLLQLLGIQKVDADEAWQIADPTWKNIIFRFFGYHGYFYVWLTAGGLLTMFASSKLRRYAVFMTANACVTFFLFTRIQDFSIFHHYLLMPYIVLFSSVFLARLASLRTAMIGPILTACILILSFLNLLYMYSPSFAFLQPAMKSISAYKTYPVRRPDMQELLRLNEDIYNLVSPEKKKITILPNSQYINHFGLNAMHYSIPGTHRLTPFLLEPSFADRRDGFPSDLFTVDYVLVSDPVQLNLKPKDQQVLVIPNDMILKHEGIGTAFAKTAYEYTLQKGIKLYIYERISKFRQKDIDAFSQMLQERYPDEPFVYTPQIPEEQIYQ